MWWFLMSFYLFLLCQMPTWTHYWALLHHDIDNLEPWKNLYRPYLIIAKSKNFLKFFLAAVSSKPQFLRSQWLGWGCDFFQPIQKLWLSIFPIFPKNDIFKFCQISKQRQEFFKLQFWTKAEHICTRLHKHGCHWSAPGSGPVSVSIHALCLSTATAIF